MNSIGIRPAPAPCKEPFPLDFRPRSVASVRSMRILDEPESRAKDNGLDPLMRTGTKIIPLRQSKAKVDSLPPLAKTALLVTPDDWECDTAGKIVSAMTGNANLEIRRKAIMTMSLPFIGTQDRK